MTGLILSLFPGIGLLDHAFEEEGFCIVRGPDLLWGGDIRGFHPPAGVFTGVIGGPPCSEFSPLRYLIAANGYKSKHGNMIPEFERCVSEALPDWFFMEEGPLAPDAIVPGYAQNSFHLSPVWIDAQGDGHGAEQSRKRRFCFGVKGGTPVDLRQFISYAVFEPMTPGMTVPAGGPPPGTRDSENSPETRARIRQPAVTHHADAYPVKRGGSGKIKRPTPLVRTWEESCKLQGLPPDFLKDAPFTMAGKRQVLGNGVPLAMGRAIARAIKRAEPCQP